MGNYLVGIFKDTPMLSVIGVADLMHTAGAIGAEGEMVTIIDPSGSGKTTALRMLMTLETINDGVIHVDGWPLPHMERDGRLVRADERHLRKMRASIGSPRRSRTRRANWPITTPVSGRAPKPRSRWRR